MRPGSQVATVQVVTTDVLTVAGILQILAIPQARASDDPRIAALVRTSSSLRELVDAGAGADSLRTAVLRAISLAEEAVREQTRRATRDATTSRKHGTAAPFSRLLKSRLQKASPQSVAVADTIRTDDELEIVRKRSDQLLAKLAELRGKIACSEQSSPTVPSQTARRFPHFRVRSQAGS